MRTDVVVFFIVTYIINNVFGDVGDACIVRVSDSPGICLSLKDCPLVLAQLKKRIHPTICNFEGTLPIVCCERDVQSLPTTTQRVGLISGQKCREYGRYVFEIVRNDVNNQWTNTSVCGVKTISLIVGGEKAKPQEFPHMALLGYGDLENIVWQCGGALISENFVITAGHCLRSSQSGVVTFVRLGELVLNSRIDDAKPVDIEVDELIRHPDWTPPVRYNDIGLIKLKRSVAFNKYIRPICLQTDYKIEGNRPGGSKFIATGWGALYFQGDFNDELMKVELDSFSASACARTYKATHKKRLPNGIQDESQMCAAGIDEAADTCQGDSGGPLQIYHNELYCMYKIVGITSFGRTCGVQGVPAVYTRVSHYIKWIEDTVWPQ